MNKMIQLNKVLYPCHGASASAYDKYCSSFKVLSEFFVCCLFFGYFKTCQNIFIRKIKFLNFSFNTATLHDVLDKNRAKNIMELDIPERCEQMIIWIIMNK